MSGIPELFSDAQWAQFSSKFKLTGRETCTFRLVCRAFGNDKIATRLGIQPPTLRTHLRSVYKKLGCHDRTHAVLLAVTAMKDL